MDLDELQKVINEKVVMEHEYSEDTKRVPPIPHGYKQQPQGKDQLRKKVFFFDI